MAEEKQMLFRDDFDRRELGPDWRVLEGSAWVEPGRLHLEGPSNVTVVCTKPFPGDVRLEYEGYVAPGSQLCDISCFLSATPAGGWRESYFLGFGSYYNTDCRIKRCGRVMAAVDKPLIERAGRVHHIAAERAGPTLSLFVDGELAVRWDDPDPLGPDQQYLGLYACGTHVVYTGVKVFKPSRECQVQSLKFQATTDKGGEPAATDS